MERSAIKETVLRYLQEKHFRGTSPESTLSLIGGGHLDSISTMKLVAFLENTFSFEFEAREVDRDNLDTVELITDFITKKLHAAGK